MKNVIERETITWTKRLTNKVIHHVSPGTDKESRQIKADQIKNMRNSNEFEANDKKSKKISRLRCSNRTKTNRYGK
jgi:hypothetical protein